MKKRTNQERELEEATPVYDFMIGFLPRVFILSGCFMFLMALQLM